MEQNGTIAQSTRPWELPMVRKNQSGRERIEKGLHRGPRTLSK